MKMKTEWNLKQLYLSPHDPQIEKDMDEMDRIHTAFEKKYRGISSYTKNEASLKSALQEYENLVDKAGSSKPLVYLYLLKDIESQNAAAEAKINMYTERLSNISNKIIFFQLELGKIPKNKQETYLKSKKLARFRHYLERVFLVSKFRLSEAEERIMNIKSLPAHEMWVNGFSKILDSQTVPFEKKEIPLSEALNKISMLPTKKRRTLFDMITLKLRDISSFSESEVNAIYTDKKINDSLRGFANPYDATLLSHETDEKMVHALRKAVVDAFPISHRFYKIKAKLLGEKKLEYADRSASIGRSKKEFTFDEALRLVRTAFENVNPVYRGILDEYLANGQIDVYPRKNKTGGGYCWGGTNLPTFILLNHVNNLNSTMTLAHEMGHAIHTEFSKSQPVLYQGYSTAVAEVASTFFEEIAYEEVQKTLSEREQMVSLHDRIQDDIQTIFRQIACFNFELDLHKLIREKGAASNPEIAKLMNIHMKEYLGPVFAMKENDGYFYVTWSHIRRFFYVYSYAYGQLISKALYKMYKEDPRNLAKIEGFLRAGSHATPENIFKEVGIDTTSTNVFKTGLRSINDNISKLEKLAKKNNYKV